jgi:hypothetical protein
MNQLKETNKILLLRMAETILFELVSTAREIVAKNSNQPIGVKKLKYDLHYYPENRSCDLSRTIVTYDNEIISDMINIQ